MQYKTISVEHYLYQGRKESFALNKKYEEIINRQAMEGWKFVGIHTLPIERRRGCMWWLLFMFWERLQVDLLIFYREDGTDAYTGPIYAAATQKPGVDFAGAAQNAMNMLNPQNAANKFNSLKKKTLSTINEITGSSDSGNNSDIQ